ncbi:MAG: GAF domain-containing protein [Desulfuromonadales bacterium]|nr:GAF domain-containing protein [Desulfuromonadales bacterium]
MNSTRLAIEALSLQLHSELTPLGGAPDAQLQLLVATLSRTFNVDLNEVAIYRLDEERGVLRFLWPEKLKHIGSIPLSSFDSLAARTAREGVVLLENSFASQRHANVYEKIRLEPGVAASPKPIQKIISAPIFKDAVVRGVIQLSRKGDANSQQTQDFTDADGTALLALAGVFGQHF